jgi:pimeloyl-ACP methyl ester carboxylesterase
MSKRLILVIFALLFAANVIAEPVVYPTNKDGSIITGVLTANFDPSAGVAPIPGNLFFLGTTDFTLNPPLSGADPEDYGNPLVALSTLDGFSTTEKWVTTFSFEPYPLDATTIVAGQTVRMFEVSTIFGTIVAVSGVVRELVPNYEYVTTVVGGTTLAIIPTSPLKEMTTYMAVMTNGIKDTQGNDATPDTTYYLSKRADPWVDEEGHSTYSLVPDADAASLESLRQMTLGHETAAATQGIDPEDIILSWTAQTQAITPVLKNLRSIARPAPTVVGPTGMDTSAVGGFGLADVYAGIITIPYYSGVPSEANPAAPLFDFWTAAPGAYVAPFDALGLDPTSTNITVANPFPVVTSMQTVPLLMSVPNAASGMTRPSAGWPVIIFGHGITRSRADMLAMADTAALAGYAVVAIDAPLHGISPDDPLMAPLYIGNHPVFKDIANERTFDVDYVNNATGAPPSDEIIDASGTHMINLSSTLTSRDNLRQGEADLSILAVTIPSISYDGDALPDLDGSTIQFVGQSMGSIMGTAFVAIEPTVNNAFLSVPMGGLARGLEASDTFGPRIRAGLEAGAGLVPGTADFEQYFLVFQTVIDSGDPINWAAEASLYNNIVLHEVINDTVVPNYVATAPLSGTEPMIRAMGLTSYSSTQSNPAGLDLVGRFVPPANHGSLLSPAGAPETTDEMQRQLGSFLATGGTTVVVTNAATMVPEVDVKAEMLTVPDLGETGNLTKLKGGKTIKRPIGSMTVDGLKSRNSLKRSERGPSEQNRTGEMR